MRRRPIADRAEGHLARFGLGPRNGFACIGRVVTARQAGHDIGHIRHHADTDKSPARVKARVGIQDGVHPLCGHGAKEQGIAIGLGLGGGHGADIAARAGAVFHPNRLSQMPRHTLSGKAAHDVGDAARRIGHDDAQGLVRKGALGMNGWRGEHTGGKRQSGAAGEVRHGKPPLIS